jgi:uncharacterized protein (TIRG00374 family)
MWRKPQIWIGLLVSVGALFLAFRGVEWNRVVDALRDAQYGYLVPAMLSLLVAMLIRAERWRWLYGERRHRLSPLKCFSALSIGYLVTNTLPLRLGEVARTIFVSRSGLVTMAHTASTIVVEHVLDVLTVLGILVVLLVTGSVPLPDWAMQGAALSAYGFGTALIVMLVLVWQRQRVERWAEQILDRVPGLSTQTWLQRVIHVLDGFAILQPGKPLVMVVFWSIAGWLSSALTFQLALLAFVPDPPFIIALFVTVTSTFALLLPATPGSLGVLQGAIVLSLAVFGLSQATALSFAIVFHVAELLVMDVVGASMLWREAGSWASMKAQLRSVTTSAATIEGQ